MAQPIEENLLEAIEKDDIKAFDEMMKETKCGGYRLGRFPVLSLMYLCKSRKIISKYEDDFIKITSWEEIREPASVAKKFSDIAGKCLRLYLSEIVSPLEMLLILDKTRRLKRVYPLTKASAGIKERLQTIYQVKYSLEIKYDGSDIILDRRPLNRGEKRKIATICLCSFLAVAVVVATPITAVALKPAEGEVTKLKHINFSKKTTYTLTRDITIPKNYSVEKMNCTIDGNGKKLIFEEGATIGELSGKITNAEIVSTGEPIFTTITESGAISSVTVNVNADIQTTESSAFIALTSYGLIDNVTVNVGGKVSALAGDSDGTTELIFGGMVLKNAIKYNAYGQATYGIIRYSTVNYSNLSLEGETLANGIFAGIAGNNGGAVGYCTVTGSITSNTFDLAGVCETNEGLLSYIVNEAALSQISESDGWNPIVCGICTNNSDTVEYCKNNGALSSKSLCGDAPEPLTAAVAGIVYSNTGDVGVCTNSGGIAVEGKGYAMAGGIAGTTSSGIYYCLSRGNISVKGETVYAGGIFAQSIITGDNLFTVTWGFAEYCISESDISVTASGEHSFVGGIAGFIMQSSVTGMPNEDGSTDILGYFGGGVKNSFFTGSVSADNAYVGNIMGTAGKNIYYGENLYFEDYVSFENNYCLALPVCGATVSAGDDNKYKYEEVTENLDASVSTREDMAKTEEYKKILEILSK